MMPRPDHGLLLGLQDDDHPQYLNDTRHTALTGDHVTGGDSHDHEGGDGAQIDHGGLSGLADDDHSQYLNETRGDARYPLLTDIGIWEAGTDPTLTTSGTDPTVTYATQVARFTQFGDTVHAVGHMDFSSVSGNPGGNYRIPLPVNIDLTVPLGPIGTFRWRDNTSGDYIIGIVTKSTATHCQLMPVNSTWSSGVLNVTDSPIETDDELWWEVTYEAA